VKPLNGIGRRPVRLCGRAGRSGRLTHGNQAPAGVWVSSGPMNLVVILPTARMRSRRSGGSSSSEATWGSSVDGPGTI